VHVIDWKDSSPKRPIVLMGALNPAHSLTQSLTYREQTNKQTHRQDRLQYTAPLASAQCN